MGYRPLWRILGVVGTGLLASVVPMTTSGASPASKAVHKVAISSTACSHLFCYQPAKLKVTSGQSVTWTNTTTAPHTVTRCTPAVCNGHGGGTGTDPGPGSPTLGHGSSYTLKFTGKGTYLYYCQIHGFAVMHGTITVT